MSLATDTLAAIPAADATTTVAQAAAAALTTATLPAIGQPLDGGLFAGCVCSPTGQLSAVVLLPQLPDTEEGRLDWEAAKAWAASIGGELPSREASLLLYRTLRAQFERSWYWTAEQHADDGAYAWNQVFYDGSQDYDHTSFEARVRAVRLIHLSA